jgi:hypothetical protein
MLYFGIILFLIGCYFLFRDTMNRLQYIGPIYWITRDIGKHKDPFLCRATMRHTAPPWKTGKGIQIRFYKYTFQVGICKTPKLKEGEDGLLHALQGRFLDIPAKQIKEWQ